MTSYRKYFILSLIIALLNVTLLLIFFLPRLDHPDTPQYISTIKNLAGDKTAEVFPYRILKPLPILLGVVFTPILKAENTLIFQNIFFYFFSICLIFLLVFRLYHNEKQAFYGTILYMGAYPMLAYGLASLTDLSGWFFYLLSVFIALNFLKNPTLKTTLASGFAAGFGMLFKENTAAAPIFFAILIFIATQLPIKEKIKNILIYGLVFLIPSLISGIVIYKIFSVSYLSWYEYAWSGTKSSGHFYLISPLRVMIEIGRVFLLGWIFFLLGIIKEFTIKNIERIKVLAAFILPSLSFFLWSYPHNRMIFISAPLLVSIGSFGLLRKYKNTRINTFLELTLIFLYILVNYIVLEFLLRYGPVIQPPGTLFG